MIKWLVWHCKFAILSRARIARPCTQPFAGKNYHALSPKRDFVKNFDGTRFAWTRLRLARNSVKTRFRRFPTFHFSTSIFFFRNFEQPFTPRGWLRSASNFGKTRFRRSPTFHFSTSKTKNWRKFLIKKFVKKVAFWKSYEFLTVTGRFLVKSYCL